MSDKGSPLRLGPTGPQGLTSMLIFIIIFCTGQLRLVLRFRKDVGLPTGNRWRRVTLSAPRPYVPRVWVTVDAVLPPGEPIRNTTPSLPVPPGVCVSRVEGRPVSKTGDWTQGNPTIVLRSLETGLANERRKKKSLGLGQRRTTRNTPPSMCGPNRSRG